MDTQFNITLGIPGGNPPPDSFEYVADGPNVVTYDDAIRDLLAFLRGYVGSTFVILNRAAGATQGQVLIRAEFASFLIGSWSTLVLPTAFAAPAA